MIGLFTVAMAVVVVVVSMLMVMVMVVGMVVLVTDERFLDCISIYR